MNAHGFFPIIVTVVDEEHGQSVIETETCKIVNIYCRTNYLRTLSNRQPSALRRKAFSFFDLMLENYSFYSYLRKLVPTCIDIIEKEKPVGMIVSAPPFSLFSLANRISKRTGIKWIADYRDDWTSNEEAHKVIRFRNMLQRRYERNSLRTASAFLSVSAYQELKIREIVSRRGFIIENGYDEYDASPKVSLPRNCDIEFSTDKLNIVYTGTLYDSQSMDFLEKVLDSLDADCRERVSMYFIGSDLGKITRSKILKKYYGVIIHSVPRIDKSSADYLLGKSDLALFIAYLDVSGNPIRGVPSSKLYEYIKCKKPVLMLPSDSDVAQETLEEVGLSISCDSVSGTCDVIEKLVIEKRKTGRVDRPVNEHSYKRFSRVALARRLAEVLEEIFL